MLHALLKSNLDCFKRFAQVPIVPICGINLPNRLCPRSEWHIIMFSGFYLDIEDVAVPAKCLSPIMYVTLKLVCENIAMILLCGLATAVIYQLPRLERIALFMLVLSDRNGLGVYIILFIISVVIVSLYTSRSYSVLCIVFYVFSFCILWASGPEIKFSYLILSYNKC